MGAVATLFLTQHTGCFVKMNFSRPVLHHPTDYLTSNPIMKLQHRDHQHQSHQPIYIKPVQSTMANLSPRTGAKVLFTSKVTQEEPSIDGQKMIRKVIHSNV